VVEWNKVKTEYIAGGTSYRKLAAKYGVSRSKLQAKATKEKWAELKSQAKAKTESKIVESVSDRAADQAVSIIDVADKLLSKICELLDADVYNTQNIKNLTSALKDLKEIKGFKSEADMREQEARIAKLQREAEKEDNTETEIKVTFGAEDKECTKWAE
jgi:hypothetical protein